MGENSCQLIFWGLSVDVCGGVGFCDRGCRHLRQGVSAFATGGVGVDFSLFFELCKVILLMFWGFRARGARFPYFLRFSSCSSSFCLFFKVFELCKVVLLIFLGFRAVQGSFAYFSRYFIIFSYLTNMISYLTSMIFRPAEPIRCTIGFPMDCHFHSLSELI